MQKLGIMAGMGLSTQLPGIEHERLGSLALG